MSVNVSAGGRFKGNLKGKLKVGGSSTIDQVDVQVGNVEAGFEFDGDAEETSDIQYNEITKVTNVKQTNVNEQKSETAVGSGSLINLDEANTATNVKEENVDRPTESSTSQMKLPVAVVKPRIAKVEPSEPDAVDLYFANIGSSTSVKTVKGNITSNMSYSGGVPKSIHIPKILPADCEVHKNVGDVTRVGDIQGEVKFNSNIHVNGQNLEK